MTKNKKKKILLLNLAVLGLIAVCVAVYAWFCYKRQIETLSWIKTPIILRIGSGNDHDIAYLDMGSIDADTPGREVDYVFCVYGEPVDMYSLQLACTTNIPFYYEIYRADLESQDNEGDVTFSYTDDDGTQHTEYFKQASDAQNAVISAEPLTKMNNIEIEAHQSHNLSYGDEEGKNATDKKKVQSNAEPLYWLANENGLSVLNPRNKGINSAGNNYFCDYFILRVKWDENTVVNDKETDMVYLTASR